MTDQPMPSPTKDGGPQSFSDGDVPLDERCVVGPAFHTGLCQNAAGKPLDRIGLGSKVQP